MDRSDESDQIERAWQYYKHADDLQHRRHLLFLTVQVALVAAFVASVSQQSLVALIFGTTGIMLAVIWVVLALSVQRGIDALNKRLEKDRIYEEYLKEVQAVRGISGHGF